MNKIAIHALALAALGVATGCEKKTVIIQTPPPSASEPVAKTKTLETSRLGSAIDSYERNPSATQEAEVKKAFADLDGEIAELEQHVAKDTGADRQEAAAKLSNLTSYRTQEQARFAAAQVKKSVDPNAPPVDARSGAEKVEDSARKVGNAIEDAARKAGDAIKDATK